MAPKLKKNIVILGSSGSIGQSALDVVRQHKDRFRVVGLSVNSSISSLSEQIKEFRPDFVAIADKTKAEELPIGLRKKTNVLCGREGVCRLASLKDVDLVLVAIVGSEAIYPLLSAIKEGKTIALANKESIVVGGDFVLNEARKRGAEIIPIDSEQNAIFQCLEGYDASMVENIYLTASGGPLFGSSKRDINSASLESVLAHPRWKMGRKITVDSATLMNKGLEVIEAQKLFSIDLDKIKVLIHRQALVHSMVEFVDGSILAQMAVTDMRLPIKHALSYPQRWPGKQLKLDPLKMGSLSFLKPECDKFPCLSLAYEAARIAGGAPCVLNAANEVAVEAFLQKKLSFGNIPRVIEKVLGRGEFPKKNLDIETIFKIDSLSRINAWRWVEHFSKRSFS